MKRVRVVVVVATVALLASVALAQPGGYDLSWWSVDGGGGAVSSGGYALSGTAGQPDAGVVSAGPYNLAGGFWGGGGLARGYRVYLPIIGREAP